MFRVIGFVSLLALGASAARADDDRSAYTRAQAKLTDQLNAVIAQSVSLEAPAPPAKRDEAASERALPHAERASR